MRRRNKEGGPTVEITTREVVGGGYDAFWRTEKRYRVVKGSRGSKKSKTTALNLICRMLRYPCANALCVRRYSNTLRDSVFSDLKWAIHRLGVDEAFGWTVSPLQITRKATGQKILFRGLDDGVKITSISVDRGVLCWVWIEEAYEIASEDDFNKLDLSIRGALPEGYFKQLTLTFNPWSAECWLKSRFFDAPDGNTFTQTTTWRCNEWLDEGDRALFEQMKERDPRRWRIESEGEWGVAEGRIYTNTECRPVDAGALRKKEGVRAVFGLDFGFADPTAFVAAFWDGGARTVYIFDEWYARGVTNGAIAAQLTARGFGGQRVICDAAEPKSIAELRGAGLRAEPARKGPDSVAYGIRLLQGMRIVVDPACREVRRELENYCYARDAAGRFTGRPDHEFSHGMDALRYAVTAAAAPSRFSFE